MKDITSILKGRAWIWCIMLLYSLLLTDNVLAQRIKAVGKAVDTGTSSITITHVIDADEPKFQGLVIKKAIDRNGLKYHIDNRDNKRERVFIMQKDEFETLCDIFSETNQSTFKQEKRDIHENSSGGGFGFICVNVKNNVSPIFQQLECAFAVTDSKTSDYFFSLISKINDINRPLTNEGRIYLTSYLLDMAFTLNAIKVN